MCLKDDEVYFGILQDISSFALNEVCASLLCIRGLFGRCEGGQLIQISCISSCNCDDLLQWQNLPTLRFGNNLGYL